MARPEPARDSWISPTPFLDHVRAFLGGIDLDPASSAAANRSVGAAVFYDAASDGMAHQWHTAAHLPARVFLHPPYSKVRGQSQARIWLDYLIEQRRRGHVAEAIFLTGVATDTEWFRAMWALPLCFIYGRLRFHRPGYSGPIPRGANVAAYVGARPAAFAAAFDAIGHVTPP